jgi:tungstate transport system ATP-binding protein
MKNFLSGEDLIVRRGGVTVLDIPSFAVDQGSIFSLIGPNGTGKSTFLQSLAGLLGIYRGRIRFKGREIARNDLVAYRRQIAFVFQEPLLLDTTVFGNVAAGLRIRRKTAREIEDRVHKALEQFGIRHLAERSARKLSGGEAQRTNLARAFAITPEIIFLDEPFASLDPPTREGLIEDLLKILRETRTTALMATHDQMEALRLADRMAIMNEGRIIQTGSPSEIINHPCNAFVASFVGTDTILEGYVVANKDGSLTVSVNNRLIQAVAGPEMEGKVLCCIRPEQVALGANEPSAATSARNVLPAVVRDIRAMGPFFKIILDCGFPLAAYITGESLDSLSLRKDMSVTASFKATAIHIIQR